MLFRSQKIKPKNLLESLTVNVFNLKKKKGGCRAKLRARLVHCNNYYMGIGINITRNILSRNVISITIH